MDAPENLRSFRGQLENHFLGSYPRCSQEIVRVRSSIFLRTVRDDNALRNTVSVHPEKLSKKGVEDLARKQIVLGFEAGTPFFKMTLVESEEAGKLFFILRIDHCLSDGMSVMQMLSAFQDNPAANPVPLPDRKLPSFIETLQKFGETGAMFGEMEKRAEGVQTRLPCQGPRSFGPDPDSRLLFIGGGQLDTAKLKSRAKEYGVTVNDLFVGAVSMAYQNGLPEGQSLAKTRFEVVISTLNKEQITNFQPANRIAGINDIFTAKPSLKEAALEAKTHTDVFKLPQVIAFNVHIFGAMCHLMQRDKLMAMMQQTWGTYTASCSNMVGSVKAPWVFGKKKVDWCAQVGVAPDIVTVSITTVGPRTSIAVHTDKGNFPYTHELGEAIVKELSQ